MTVQRVRDSATGTVFSVLVHVCLLLLLAGWTRGASSTLPTPLSVELWMEPATASPAKPDPDPDISEPEPATASVPDVNEPDVPATPEPPRLTLEDVSDEPPVPPLPDVALTRPEETVVPPLAGDLPAPAMGPSPEERGRLLETRPPRATPVAVRRDRGSKEAPSPQAREQLASSPERSGFERGKTTLAAERGITGPLGERGILYSETPVYPEWARRLGLEALVRIKIWVSPAGEVTRVETTQHSGSREMDDIAVQALKKWRFEPLPSGVPWVDQWGEVPMSFTLVSGADETES